MTNLPGPGESRSYKIPTGDLSLTLERMVHFIREGHKDPVVIETARDLAVFAGQVAKDLDMSGPLRLHYLQAIHAWGRQNFMYVDDPVGVELLQTPARMVRATRVKPENWEAYAAPLIGPMKARLAAKYGARVEASVVTTPKATGDSDEATVLALAMAAAIGIESLRIRLGGTDVAIHYAWGAAAVEGKWHDLDFLCERFGQRPKGIELLEERDVPLG